MVSYTRVAAKLMMATPRTRRRGCGGVPGHAPARQVLPKSQVLQEIQAGDGTCAAMPGHGTMSRRRTDEVAAKCKKNQEGVGSGGGNQPADSRS